MSKYLHHADIALYGSSVLINSFNALSVKLRKIDYVNEDLALEKTWVSLKQLYWLLSRQDNIKMKQEEQK